MPNLTAYKVPIFYYPDPSKWYIVNMDASDDACGAQLSLEHNDQELPFAFLSHSQTLNENGAFPHKKPVVYIIP